MATMLTITINGPTNAFDHKNSEIRYLEQALEDARTELGKGSGNVASGTCAGKGSWSYTAVATLP
jgi:hypothetical protein